MANKDWIKAKEAQLVTQCQDVSGKISAAASDYDLTVPEAAALASDTSAFVSAYEAATDPATKTKVTVELKRLAKVALVARMREYGQRIQANKSISSALKIGLGLNPRDVEPTPIENPVTAPVVSVRSAFNWTIDCRLADSLTPNKRARPFGVAGAKIFIFIGEEPPAELSAWKFEGLSTRSAFSVVLPASTAPGAKVWICAAWYSPRGASGPVSSAVSAYCVGGVSAQAA
ncbi:MAG: hypothetical protein QOF78_2604 [Phycisphaerales bacterium]|jgi:hypothetical protein|nr:hypothetical protein [Phycisphaerales bacterium]